MAAVRQLEFVGGSRGTTQEARYRLVVVPCKNFVMSSLVIFKLKVSDFLSFAFESPVHGAKISVLDVPPKI